MNKIKNYIGLAMISLSFGQIQAQEEPVNGLDTVRFSNNIIPEVTDAVKIPFHPQLHNVTDSIKIKEYHVPKYPFKFEYLPKKFKPLAFKKSREKALNTNLIKLGLGVPLVYDIEAYYSSDRSKDLVFGAYVDHYHLNGGTANRSVRTSDISLFGKKIFNKDIIEANISFGNYLHEFIDPDSLVAGRFGSTIPNVQNHLRAAGRIYNFKYEEDEIRYDLYGNLNYSTSSMYNANGINGHGGAIVSNQLGTGMLFIDLSNELILLNNESSSLTNITTLKTYYDLEGKDWKVRLGIMAALDQNAPLILPEFYSEKILVEKYLTTYSGWKGNIEGRDLERMLFINPYWDIASVELTNSYNNIKYAGFKGAHDSKLSYDIRFERNDVKNNLLFVTSEDSMHKFESLYEDMSVTSSILSLGYQLNDKFNSVLENRFYLYNMASSTETQAWHMPNYAITWLNHYNIQDLIEVDLSILFQGETYNRVGDTEYINDGFVDASLGIDYHYHKNLSIYLDINNILGTRYNIWYNYPTVGLNVIGGVKFSF